MYAEYFPGGDTLDYLYDHLRRHHRYTLDEKMHMVFVSSDLNKMDFVPLLDLQTYFLKRVLHVLCKDFPSMLRGAHNVVEKKGLVVVFKDMFTHSSILTHNEKQGPSL